MALSPSTRVFLNKLKWFIYEKATSVYDRFLFATGIRGNVGKKMGDAKIIVNVGETLPPRIARIAKWSKKYDKFSTILLCHKRGFVEKFSNPDIDKTLL